MKKNIILISLIISSIAGYGQQDVILTRYTFSSLFFNPAYAGSAGHQEGSILVNYRDQWMGIDGAPSSILFGGDANLFDDRVGAGLTLARESIGIDKRIDILGNVAYRILLDNDAVISGGLRIGYHLFSSDFEKLTNINASDPLYREDVSNFSVISVGAGVYYNSKVLYAGLSVPAIASVSSSERSSFKSRHYYFHTGALLGDDEYSEFAIEPSILLKYQKAAPLQYTIGGNIWLKDNFAVGLFYRSSNAIALSMEYIIDDRLSFSAAYDFTTNDLKDETNGTMEFLVGYRLYYGYDGVPMGKSRRFR